MQQWWRWEPTGLSPFETQRARLMWRALIALVLLTVPIAPLHLILSSTAPSRALGPLAASLVYVLLGGLLRAGYGQWAARLNELNLMCAVAIMMPGFGGMRGPLPFLALVAATWAVLFLPTIEAAASILALIAILVAAPSFAPPESLSPELLADPLFLMQVSVVLLVAIVGGSTLDAMRTEEEHATRRTEERRAATAEAVEATQAKAQFLATMSHELRTPLNAILGYAGLLREVRGPADAELQHVELAGFRLLHLVEDLLEIARVDANVTPLTFEDVNLTEVVVGAVAAAGVACTLRTPERPLVVRTDRARVRRILTNLIREAASTHGPPEVSLVTRPGGSEIVVHNAAQAVPADWARRALEPFARLEPDSGTGLALNLALRLSRQIGGEVRVEATEGRATYTLAIPAAP